MNRDACTNCGVTFGCCLGMIICTAMGSLYLAQQHTYGSCWVNSEGSCTRSCDDRFTHCTFSPLYANATFRDGVLDTICEWRTAPHYTLNATCQAALEHIGFSGNCIHYAGQCIDPSYAPTATIMGSFFLTISGCCMLFFVWVGIDMLRARKADREQDILLQSA
jgi:hypothetical protein